MVVVDDPPVAIGFDNDGGAAGRPARGGLAGASKAAVMSAQDRRRPDATEIRSVFSGVVSSSRLGASSGAPLRFDAARARWATDPGRAERRAPASSRCPRSSTET